MFLVVSIIFTIHLYIHFAKLIVVPLARLINPCYTLLEAEVLHRVVGSRYIGHGEGS